MTPVKLHIFVFLLEFHCFKRLRWKCDPKTSREVPNRTTSLEISKSWSLSGPLPTKNYFVTPRRSQKSNFDSFYRAKSPLNHIFFLPTTSSKSKQKRLDFWKLFNVRVGLYLFSTVNAEYVVWLSKCISCDPALVECKSHLLVLVSSDSKLS